MPENLKEARNRFIHSWGEMGPQWGINRTMAQLHALLMISEKPLSTDDVMEELGISRGNANMNLRSLVDWGVARRAFVKGDRKEYFQSEKDVWNMFCRIARERKKREIEPSWRRCGNAWHWQKRIRQQRIFESEWVSCSIWSRRWITS